MKIANIIGKIAMVIFGIASIMWVVRMFGGLGMRFNVDDMSKVVGCIICFIISLIVTVSTRKHK